MKSETSASREVQHCSRILDVTESVEDHLEYPHVQDNILFLTVEKQQKPILKIISIDLRLLSERAIHRFPV